MKVDLYSAEGQVTDDQVELPGFIFNVEPNDHLIYQAVVTEMSNRRLGSHAAKTRAEKRGGGRKPWRQKGTGRARAGTIRSPLWVGGGVTFPPKPHKHHKKMNRKAKRSARRSAFTYRASEGSIFVISDMQVEEPNTKRIAALLDNMGLADKKTLILHEDVEENLYLSTRNLQYVTGVKKAAHASVYDVLDCEALVITQSGLEQLIESLGEEN